MSIAPNAISPMSIDSGDPNYLSNSMYNQSVDFINQPNFQFDKNNPEHVTMMQTYLSSATDQTTGMPYYLNKDNTAPGAVDNIWGPQSQKGYDSWYNQQNNNNNNLVNTNSPNTIEGNANNEINNSNQEIINAETNLEGVGTSNDNLLTEGIKNQSGAIEGATDTKTEEGEDTMLGKNPFEGMKWEAPQYSDFSLYG